MVGGDQVQGGAESLHPEPESHRPPQAGLGGGPINQWYDEVTMVPNWAVSH